MSSGPLNGLIVVDASWGLASGLTTMMLADYGARVIKLEQPGRDVSHDASRRTLQRGKWSVEADLTTDEGQSILHRLLKKADVFLESFGPGRADSLGIGYEALHTRYPELVFASLSGYGTEGPLAQRPGYEALLNARMGMTAEQGGHRDGPIFLGHPTVSYGTSFITIIGILAALRARKLNGTGQKVETSLLDGMLTLASMNWWWNERDISYLARSGKQTGFGRTRLITDPFECADGEYLTLNTASPGSYKKTMDLLGFGDQTQTIEGTEMSVPLNDEEVNVARNLVPQAFLSKPRDEWVRILRDADIAVLPVLHPGEAFDDEQVKFARIVQDVPDREYGTVRQVGPVVLFEKSAPQGLRQAPLPGEHNERIGELELSPHWRPRAENRKRISAPLEGVRILDFSTYFATGFGTRLLSDLGADVIKVEQLSGDPMRPLGDLFESAQRGKRGIAVNLSTPEGREIAQRLVAETDMVMHNFRPGKAEKIGMGYEELKAINPELLYVYLPGFGSDGPKANLRSFAPLLSGLVGLPYEAAGVGNPPVRRAMGNEDQYNGFLAAISGLLGLHHQLNTGESQLIESPQINSSMQVVSQNATDMDGNLLPSFQLDKDQTGWSALYRLYRTAEDGWIMIAAVGNSSFAKLAEVLGVNGLAQEARYSTEAKRAEHREELSATLQAAFLTRNAQEMFAELDAVGVPVEIPSAHPTIAEFFWEEWAVESGRVFEHYHPEYGWSREVGLTIKLSDTPGQYRGTSPRLGQHTAEILDEIGYGEAEKDKLIGSICSVPAPFTEEEGH